MEQDRAVIRAARSAAAEDLQVMVEYNQSLSVPEAIGRVQLLEEEALVWVEEPTRADDFAGHARIAAQCRTPIQGRFCISADRSRLWTRMGHGRR